MFPAPRRDSQGAAPRRGTVYAILDGRNLLGWLGTVRDGAFRALPAKLRELRSEQAPDSALRGIGIRHIYHIKLEGYDPDDEALVYTFLVQVRAILDSWNQAAAVELHADTSGSPLQLPVQ